MRAQPILTSGAALAQPCKSGGAIKFGVPWPKSSKPLARIDVSIDGASQNIELATSTSVVNIVTSMSPTQISSTASAGTAAAFAVDGDPATGAQSAQEDKPIWRVDLGKAYDVHSVHVTACETNKQTNLRVFVNDVEPLATNNPFAFDALTMCGAQPLETLPMATTKAIACKGRRGRFVGLQVEDSTTGAKTSLEICEVKVFVLPQSDTEAVTVTSDPNDVEVDASGYLFKNFLRSARIVHRTVTDGSENKVTCPKGFTVAFGFSVQMTSDPSLRSCALANNKACTPGAQDCTAAACGSPQQNAPGVMNSLVYAVCARGNVVWPPPERSTVVTVTGDGSKGLIACPRGQVLAFGFGLQWTPFASSGDASRRCLLRNNKACVVGAKQCEQELCRSSDGGIADRDVSFLWGVCVREGELPFSKSSVVSRTEDGALARSDTPGGTTNTRHSRSRSRDLSCPGKSVAFGFGWSHSHVRSSLPSLDWSRGDELRFDPHALLSLSARATAEHASLQGGDVRGQRAHRELNSIARGIIPEIRVNRPSSGGGLGTCVNTDLRGGKVVARASSTNPSSDGKTGGDVCRLFDDGNSEVETSGGRTSASEWRSQSGKAVKDVWIDAQTSSTRTVRSYMMQASATDANALGRAPARWRVLAETDTDTWVVVDDTHSGLVGDEEGDAANLGAEPAWSLGERRYFVLPSSAVLSSHRYRIAFDATVESTAGTGTSGVQLAQVQFYEEDASRSPDAWPRDCTGASGVANAREARIVRAFDEVVRARAATGSGFNGQSAQLFTDSFLDSASRFYAENTFGAARASHASCLSQSLPQDTPGDPDVVFSMAVCLPPSYFHPVITVRRGGVASSRTLSVSLSARDTSGDVSTATGLVETSSKTLAGAPTVDFVRPQGGQIEIGLQTTPLHDNGGNLASLTYAVFMARDTRAATTTSANTRSPVGPTTIRATPSFPEQLPNITLRGLVTSYDPALRTSYAGRDFGDQLQDIASDHFRQHIALARSDVASVFSQRVLALDPMSTAASSDGNTMQNVASSDSTTALKFDATMGATTTVAHTALAEGPAFRDTGIGTRLSGLAITSPASGFKTKSQTETGKFSAKFGYYAQKGFTVSLWFHKSGPGWSKQSGSTVGSASANVHLVGDGEGKSAVLALNVNGEFCTDMALSASDPDTPFVDVTWTQTGISSTSNHDNPAWSGLSWGWHQVIMVYKDKVNAAPAATVSLYLDGRASQVLTLTHPLPDDFAIKHLFGPGIFSDSNKFSGHFGLSEIYASPLEARDVETLYRAIAPRYRGTAGTSGSSGRAAIARFDTCSAMSGGCDVDAGPADGAGSSPMTYYRSTGSGAFQLGAIARGAEHHARMELGGVDFCAGSNANAADAEETASMGGDPETFKASTTSRTYSVEMWVKPQEGFDTVSSSAVCASSRQVVWKKADLLGKFTVAGAVGDDSVQTGENSYPNCDGCGNEVKMSDTITFDRDSTPDCSAGEFCAGALTLAAICSSQSAVHGVEWKSRSKGRTKAVGLSTSSEVVKPADLNFGILMKTDGSLRIIENGFDRGQLASSGHAANVRLQLRIRARDGRVDYFVDGALKHTSESVATFPLRFGVAFTNNNGEGTYKTPAAQVRKIRWITRSGNALTAAKLALQGEVIVLGHADTMGSFPANAKVVSEADFFNRAPDMNINDDAIPTLAGNFARGSAAAVFEQGLRPGTLFASRFYGNFIAEDRTVGRKYKFCAEASAGYEYIGIDIDKDQVGRPFAQSIQMFSTEGANATSEKPRHCVDVLAKLGAAGTVGKSWGVSDVYEIYPGGGASKRKVRCDFDAQGAPWTVIQMREPSSGTVTSFDKPIADYMSGGFPADQDVSGSYWIGLDHIRAMTDVSGGGAKMELRVELCRESVSADDGPGEKCVFASYAGFSVGAQPGYELHVGEYLGGTAGDALSGLSGNTFTKNCGATKGNAGWWFSSTCDGESNLNGAYATNGKAGTSWYPWDNSYDQAHIVRVTMSVRPSTGDWHRLLAVSGSGSNGLQKSDCSAPITLERGLHAFRYFASGEVADVTVADSIDCDVRKDGDPDETACKDVSSSRAKYCEWDALRTSGTFRGSGQCVARRSGVRLELVGLHDAGKGIPILSRLFRSPVSTTVYDASGRNSGGHLLTSTLGGGVAAGSTPGRPVAVGAKVPST